MLQVAEIGSKAHAPSPGNTATQLDTHRPGYAHGRSHWWYRQRCPVLAFCFAACCSSIESSLSSKAHQQTMQHTNHRTPFCAGATLAHRSFVLRLSIPLPSISHPELLWLDLSTRAQRESAGGLFGHVKRHVVPLTLDASPHHVRFQLTISSDLGQQQNQCARLRSVSTLIT